MITIEQRKKIIEKYIPFANCLAKSYNRPKNITFDEIQSAAFLGLCDAASRINSFEELDSFSPNSRIYGEIKDYLRSLNWGKRDHYMSPIILDVEMKFYPKMEEEGLDYILNKIGKIFGKEIKQIFSWKYVEGKKIEEIANSLGKTKGRISQIMSMVAEELRPKLLAA